MRLPGGGVTPAIAPPEITKKCKQIIIFCNIALAPIAAPDVSHTQRLSARFAFGFKVEDTFLRKPFDM
jgi:hypothetical protein